MVSQLLPTAARAKQARACCGVEKAPEPAKALLSGHRSCHQTEAEPTAYFFLGSTDGIKLRMSRKQGLLALVLFIFLEEMKNAAK